MNNVPDDHLINHPWLIGGFAIAVVIMLLLDLGVFNKKSLLGVRQTLRNYR